VIVTKLNLCSLWRQGDCIMHEVLIAYAQNVNAASAVVGSSKILSANASNNLLYMASDFLCTLVHEETV